MHRCLLILEVLSQICLHLKLQRAQASLASLAQTSRAIHDSALNHLWGTLSSFLPLVECLSEDVWKEVELARGERTITIARPLRVAEWARFREYANRVCELNHDAKANKAFIQIHASVFLALSSPALPEPLFPNMRSLVWNDLDSEDAFRFLNVALGQKAHSVQITLPDPNRTSRYSTGRCNTIPAVRFLPSIARCTQLECLDLTHTRSSSQEDEYNDVISELVLQLRHLVDLSCGVLDHDALVHLGRLPSLSCLSFTLPAENATKRLVGQNLFLNLESLVVHSLSSFDETCDFLDVFAKRPKELEFHGPTLGYPALLKLINKLADVDTSVSHADAYTELSFIAHEIVIDTDFPADPADPALRLSDLAPLCTFRALEHLTIEDYMPIALADADLAALASAWPALRTFNVGGKCGWPGAPRVTFAGVLAVLRACPRLETLGLVFDARKRDGLAPAAAPGSGGQGRGRTRPGAGVCNRSVKGLMLGNSPIDDAKRVAAALSDVAPRVTAICSWDEGVHGHVHDAARMRAMWASVAEWVSTFASIREEERAWKVLQEAHDRPAGG